MAVAGSGSEAVRLRRAVEVDGGTLLDCLRCETRLILVRPPWHDASRPWAANGQHCDSSEEHSRPRDAPNTYFSAPQKCAKKTRRCAPRM